MSEKAIHQIIEICHRLHDRGFVANHDGNVSFKLDENRILATPTSFAKKDIREEDLLILDGQGRVIEGKHKVFGEIAWHLAIYSVRPDIKSVVHAHPPAATGMGLAGKTIGTPAIPEAIVSLGKRIQLTDFIDPTDGSNLREEMSKAFSEADACLVPGNGAWSVGLDPMTAYLRLELVEQLAKAYQAADSFGGVAMSIPDEIVRELLARRPRPSVEKVTPAPGLDVDLRQVILEELNQILQSSNLK